MSFNFLSLFFATADEAKRIIDEEIERLADELRGTLTAEQLCGFHYVLGIGQFRCFLQRGGSSLAASRYPLSSKMNLWSKIVYINLELTLG